MQDHVSCIHASPPCYVTIATLRLAVTMQKRLDSVDPPHSYHNRRRKSLEVEERLGASYVTLDDLFRSADTVFLVCPLTPETRNIVDARALGLMKSSACLVNVSRGLTVDTEALVDALQSGKIGSAGLDVTEPEPLPVGHPLLGMDNCVVLPHRGSASFECRRAMAELCVENLVRGLRGEPLAARCNE